MSKDAKVDDNTQVRAHTGSKYRRRVKGAVAKTDDGVSIVDVYSLIETYKVTCPARQHAIKKLLCAGLRDKGSQLQDLQETRDAVSRAIELQEQREAEMPTDPISATNQQLAS